MSANPKSSPDSAEKSPGPARPEAAQKGDGGTAEARRERLAQALRDNLKKRKAQQRRRQDGEA